MVCPKARLPTNAVEAKKTIRISNLLEFILLLRIMIPSTLTRVKSQPQSVANCELSRATLGQWNLDHRESLLKVTRSAVSV